MAQNKTIETKQSVKEYVSGLKNKTQAQDCNTLIKILNKHTGLKAKMWGNAIIGFGSYHYVYESGREGDAPLIAFSPRVNALSFYLSGAKNQPALLKKLGTHKLSGGCIHVKKLEDINLGVLLQLTDISIKILKTKYP